MTSFSTKILNKILKIPEVHNGQIELADTVVSTLKLFQSWPANKSKYRSIFDFLVFFAFCNILLAGLWGHTIKLYLMGRFNYNDLAVDFGILTLGLSSYQYCSYLFRHRYLAAELLKKMGDFREYDKPPGIEYADAVLNALYKGTIYTLVGVTPILLWYYMSQSCEDVDDFYCGLVFPGYIPGMMGHNVRKGYVVVQTVATWCYSLLGIGDVWVGLHMAEYLCLYLKHCQTITKKIAEIDDFYLRKMQVYYLLRYHHRILFLHKDYHIVARGMYVVHAISTPIVMAMMLHTLIIDFQVQCFLIFVMWTGTMFIVCFMGQRMINESDILANVVYETIPFDGDLYTSKALMFMLQQTQRPLMVPAGSLTYCAYPLFMAACKATYSYLTLLESTS